jgi:ubiquinone/menaquinone biosynthesis C-methylase UbiE
MGKALEKKSDNLCDQLYGWVCGRELAANLLHFQFLPTFYLRRDITRDGAKLTGTLLDLGCGSQPFRQYLTGVTHYVGLDYPPTQECLATKVRSEIHGDARSLPFADQSFDGVLCSQVLEHVNRPETVVREMSRILKPGGLGIISLPFFYNLHMEPNDYFRFSPYGIKGLLEGNGLDVCQLRGQGGIGTLLVQMFHNWLFSELARRARRHVLLRGLLALALPFLLLLSTLNNLAALALDQLNRNDLRFTPNLWVVVKKMST